jgi:putative two-component system response regulator
MANPTDISRQIVLVVDDVPDNIAVLDGILRSDYQVRAAINGRIALEIAQSDTPPDIILLDVMMPDLDGFEVCRILKEKSSTCDIPVIFVTAMDEVKNEARGFELGAVDYIHKPISPALVKARVRTHLALYDQNRELERRVHERTSELNQTRMQVIRQLGRAGEFRDNETGMHVIRVSHYCRLLAQAAGMKQEDVEMIFNASPMHDIGKIGIRDSILLKPGKLDEDEFAVMRMHATIGAEILGEHSSALHDMAREIALTHHEKWNGTGYPASLAAEDIPLVGRITAIADVFDALTSERPYKKAWSVEDALALIQNEAGQHFDPKLVELFVEIFPQIIQSRETYADSPEVVEA